MLAAAGGIAQESGISQKNQNIKILAKGDVVSRSFTNCPKAMFTPSPENPSYGFFMRAVWSNLSPSLGSSWGQYSPVKKISIKLLRNRR